MVNRWSARIRKALKILWVVLIVVCMIELVGLRYVGALRFDHAAIVLLFAAPFFLFGAVHLVLMTASWLQPEAASSFFVTLKRGAFSVLFVIYLVIVIAFVGHFGVHIW